MRTEIELGGTGKGDLVAAEHARELISHPRRAQPRGAGTVERVQSLSARIPDGHGRENVLALAAVDGGVELPLAPRRQSTHERAGREVGHVRSHRREHCEAILGALFGAAPDEPISAGDEDHRQDGRQPEGPEDRRAHDSSRPKSDVAGRPTQRDGAQPDAKHGSDPPARPGGFRHAGHTT